MLYSLGQLTTDTAASTGIPWAIVTGATPGRVRILELGWSVAVSGTSNNLGYGRPAALGVTPGGNVDFIPEDDIDALPTGSVQGVLSWGTKPTLPTNNIVKISAPAAVQGAGQVFNFPRGLIIPASSNFVIGNIAASACSTFDVYAIVEI